MIRLHVNVDHVATVREARKGVEPDPLQAALIAEKAGAYGITVHLREDRRHIQDEDVRRIRQEIKTPLNLEMAPVEEMYAFAEQIRPHQISLVPEKRQEITTEGGLNVCASEKELGLIRERFQPTGIKFSLFVDPVIEQVAAAHKIGAHSIELNTGSYSESAEGDERQSRLDELRIASAHAKKLGLKVFAGHGLTAENVISIATIPEIEELNIGHSLVSRSIYYGLEKAIGTMLESIEKGVSLRKA